MTVVTDAIIPKDTFINICSSTSSCSSDVKISSPKQSPKDSLLQDVFSCLFSTICVTLEIFRNKNFGSLFKKRLFLCQAV